MIKSDVLVKICKICKLPFNPKNARFDICSNECRKKARCDTTRKWYYNDIEHARKVIRNSHQRHREKEKIHTDIYRKKHKEYFSIKSKEWYWENKKKAQKTHKEWFTKNKDRKYYINHKRRKCNKKAGKLPSFEIVQKRMNLFNGCCFCGRFIPLTLEHLIPLSKGGINREFNLFGSCKKCNCSKNKQEWKSWFRKQEFYTPEREICIINYSDEGIKMEVCFAKK